jgi:hypothetical protein
LGVCAILPLIFIPKIRQLTLIVIRALSQKPPDRGLFLLPLQRAFSTFIARQKYPKEVAISPSFPHIVLVEDELTETIEKR